MTSNPDFWRILLTETVNVLKLRPHSLFPKREPIGDVDEASNFVLRPGHQVKLTQAGFSVKAQQMMSACDMAF